MKILHIDDHPLFSEGLKAVLSQSMTTHQFLTALNAEIAFEVIQQDQPDLILLDLAMPDINGLEFIQHMIQKKLTIPVAIISANEDIVLIKQALALGAVGFLPKEWDQERLANAISTIEKGEIVIPEHIRTAMNTINTHHKNIAEQLSVSKRQLEVLELMAQGLSNKQISDVLFIGENTVKTHIKGLFSAFSSKNRVDCINSARKVGLL